MIAALLHLHAARLYRFLCAPELEKLFDSQTCWHISCHFHLKYNFFPVFAFFLLSLWYILILSSCTYHSFKGLRVSSVAVPTIARSLRQHCATLMWMSVRQRLLLGFLDCGQCRWRGPAVGEDRAVRSLNTFENWKCWAREREKVHCGRPNRQRKPRWVTFFILYHVQCQCMGRRWWLRGGVATLWPSGTNSRWNCWLVARWSTLSWMHFSYA